MRRNSCFERSYIPKLFSDSEWMFSAAFWKFFPTFPEKYVYKKHFFLKKSCHSRVKAEIFSDYLAKRFRQDAQNCISVVQRSVFPERNCFLKKIFFRNWTWSKNFLIALRKTWTNLKVYRNILKKNFPFWQKTFSAGLRTLTGAFSNFRAK